MFEHAGVALAAEDQVLLSVEYGDIGQALARLSPEMRAVIQAVVLDGRDVAGGRGPQRPGGRDGRLRGRVPGRRHHAAPDLFALLAAAAASSLDEPASLVVDVTPTGPVRRTQIRALALLAPLTAGVLVLLAAALRGLASPVSRWFLAPSRPDSSRRAWPWTRTGEPGATAVPRRRPGADGTQPHAAGRALGPHVPGDDGLEASRTPPCGQPHPPRRPTPFCLGRPVRSVDGTYPD